MPSIINATTSTGLVSSADNSGELRLQTNSGNTAMTITTAQRVGIGTTTPTTNLQVTGAGSGTFGAYNDPLIVKGSDYTLLYVNGTNGVAATIYDYNSSNGWYVGTNNSASYRIGYMSSIDQSGVSNAKDGSSGLIITTGGAVCMGVTSALSTGATLSLASGTNNTSIAMKGDTGTNCGSIYYLSATNGNKYWQTAANQNNFFIFDDDGSNYAYLAQNPTAWLFASDARIKKDIVDLPYGLDTILAVQPRRFAYISDGKEDIGFIAQELQQVVPEAVAGEEIPYSDDDTPMERASKTMGVSKDKLIPILVKAIQELKAELDATKAEVAALKGVA